jgi:hypothetical protein
VGTKRRRRVPYRSHHLTPDVLGGLISCDPLAIDQVLPLPREQQKHFMAIAASICQAALALPRGELAALMPYGNLGRGDIATLEQYAAGRWPSQGHRSFTPEEIERYDRRFRWRNGQPPPDARP